MDMENYSVVFKTHNQPMMGKIVQANKSPTQSPSMIWICIYVVRRLLLSFLALASYHHQRDSPLSKSKKAHSLSTSPHTWLERHFALFEAPGRTLLVDVSLELQRWSVAFTTSKWLEIFSKQILTIDWVNTLVKPPAHILEH